MPKRNTVSYMNNIKYQSNCYFLNGFFKKNVNIEENLNVKGNVNMSSNLNVGLINNKVPESYTNLLQNRLIQPDVDELIDVTGLGGNDSNGNLITNFRWFGGTIGLNGNIYYAPYDATNILELNTSTKTPKSIQINYSKKTIQSKWKGGVCAFNNKIYFAPSNADKILVLNLENNSTYTLDYVPSGRDASGNAVLDISNATNQYWGACLDPNENVIFIPNNALQFMKLNPTNDNITYYGFDDISNNAFYKLVTDLIPAGLLGSGGALASNGEIYCGVRIPNNNNYKNLYIAHTDSINETVSFIDISGFNFGGAIAEGIVTGLDPRYVFLVPYEMGPYGNLRNLKYIDTSSNTLLTVPHPAGLSVSYSSYSGGVLAPDGKIYCFSFVGRNTILAMDSLDPSNNSIAVPNPNASTLRMYGGILGTDGLIYSCPYRSDYIQIVKPLIHNSNGYMVSPYYNKS